MAKRLFAWVLVLTLVLSMIPAITLGITAEEALDQHTSHEGWTEWTDATKLPDTAGNYYLSVDVNLTASWTVPNGDTHLCLNGHHITQTANKRVIGIAAGNSLSVYDCAEAYEGDTYKGGTITGGKSNDYGHGIWVDRGTTNEDPATFNLYGGRICGNKYVAKNSNGGAVYLRSSQVDKAGGVFNMYGGEIYDNEAVQGSAVYLSAESASADRGTVPATFNMYGGKIWKNTSTKFTYKNSKNEDVTLCGSAITGIGNAVINIQGGELSENISDVDGGAICAKNSVQVTVKNAKLEGNESKGNGGAIYTQDYVNVKVENSQLTGNKAKTSGGGIYTKSNVKLTVTGSQITGNTSANASAIYAQNNVKITIKDSTITENIGSSTSAEGYGAALYICGDSTKVVVSGKTKIADNVMKNANIADLFIDSSAADAANEMLYVKDLSGYVKFGVKDKAASVTEASDIVTFEGAASSFSNGAVSYMAGTEEKHVGLVDGAFKFITGHFHNGVEYTEWTDGAKLPSSGTYYLGTNVTLTAVDNRANIKGGNTLHLCLNGKTVTQNIPDAGKSESSELIRVQDGSLYLDDCTTVYDENGYFVSGGKLMGANKKGNGSALYINKAASVVEVTGIEFAKNNSTVTSVSYGGGAVMARWNTTPAKFVGCKFSKNTAPSAGGAAMAARDGGAIEAEKCYFYKNSSKDGGAIYVYESKLTLKDCVFDQNTATSATNSSGGAISMATDTEKSTTNTVVIEGCTIQNNQAANAGAINILGVSKVTIKDTAITGNTNTSKAGYGAVNLGNSNAVVKLQGKTVIYDNLNKNGDQQNLHAQQYEGVDYDLSGLTEGAKIGVSLISTRIEAGYMYFSTTGMTVVPSGVTSDDAAYEVVVDDQGRLALAATGSVTPPVVEAHSHKLCNDAACTAHGDAVSFEKWDKTDSLPPSGNYYLENDVELTAAARLSDDLTLCLNGHTITQTKADRVFYVTSGKTLTITDCATAYVDGAYKGGQIVGGVNDTGASVFVLDGSTFNLYAGRLTGSRPSSSNKASAGAAVFLRSADKANATFNMYGGEITGNGNKYCWGGAVSNGSGNAKNTVYVNIYGGSIYGNTAGTGGAIRMMNKSVTTIYGGKIYDNTANTNGGAIYLSSGAPELVIKGGTIEGNTAAAGAGIYASSGAKITLEGDVTIYDNTASGKQNNLYLAGDDKITLGDLEDTAKIGIGTATVNRAISTEADTDYSARFTPDNSKMIVTYKEKALWLEKLEVSDHYHCVCDGVKNDVCDHAEQKWIKWGDDEEEIGNLPTTSGYYYLTQDVQLIGAQSMSSDQDIYLCLNGKTVTAAQNNRHMQLAKGTTLSITDCTDAPGGFTGGYRTYGGSTNIVAGSTLNLFAGKFYGNTAPNNEGGAIYLQGSKVDGGVHIAGGVFNMYGGEISGNTAKWGAGVRAAGIGKTGEKDPSVFNMYGGIITGNQAVCEVKVNEDGTETKSGGQGGGVAITFSTEINLYGGSIDGNTAESDGGGIYMNEKAKLYIKDGKIENNVSGSTGGGIFATGVDTTIDMDGGAISGNSAKNGGGVITQTCAFFTMNGGTISGNQTSSNGAGIYVSINTDFVMNGGAISGNYAKGSGAGFYALRSRATLNGGSVSDNKADYRAGGFASSGGTVVLNKVTVSGNEAPEGGAAYINRASTGSGENIKYYPSTVTINDGALITGNKGGTNCGGILMANDGVVVTMNGGEISKNTSTNGAGFMTWRGSLFVLKGGKIVNNKATGSGAGGYVSTDSSFKMEGGSISNNTAKSGGALYLYRSNATFSGGTISYNRAQHTSTWKDGKETKSGGNAGGMYIYGAKANLSGTSFIGNYSTVNGGAVMMGRASYTENGVKKYCNVTVNISSGLYSGNKTEGAGGFMLIQSEGTVVNMYGGTVTNNEAKNAGGIYVSTKTKFNMTGGTITRNHATNQAGAIYVLKSTANITGGRIYGNTAVSNSGLIMVNGDTAVLNIKNMKLHDGVAKTAGTMVVQARGHVFAENCDFYDNTADGGTGGAVYISNNSYGDFTDCKFYNNTSSSASGAMHAAINSKINITRCDFTENTTNTMGGAMYCNPKTVINITDSTFSKNTAGTTGGALVCRGTMYLTNVTIENCTAENGGAVATDTNNTSGAGVRDGLIIKGSVIRNNTATQQGGAFYIWKGRPLELYDSKITDNTSGAEGGAIWAYEDVELHSTQITGNTSGGEGYAVYMNDANYDGHSYYTSKNKLSGDTVIKDNQGGNLWMGPDVTFAITAEGLSKGVHIELTMDSGVVTNRILGAYHYEGGNQVYTITYGDRSMTDPEYDASLVKTADEKTEKTDKTAAGDTWLYVGIGAFVAVIIAIAAVVIAKKKKAGNTAEKASKE